MNQQIQSKSEPETTKNGIPTETNLKRGRWDDGSDSDEERKKRKKEKKMRKQRTFLCI